MEHVTVVKIGGKVIDDPPALQTFLQAFVCLPGSKILVHGGGKALNELSTRLGIPPRMVDGRRITDGETLDLAVMVYGGLINKKIVAALQALGQNALGLSGADGNVIRAKKRPSGKVDYGWVGDVEWINDRAMYDLLQIGFTPVFCALTHDGQGHLLNTNADTVATELAIALSNRFAVRLLFGLELPGVLRDVNDASSLITRLTRKEYETLLKDNRIHSGMLPKLENAFRALRAGVKNVVILHHSALEALQTSRAVLGTQISLI